MPVVEETVDEIYDLLHDLDAATALEVLTAAVMGTLDRCAEPDRALLGVVAELTQLVRFGDKEPEPEPGKALPLADWIRDTWKEKP